ncbi:MAG: hypothetical protein K9K67_10735 [Bacteriovoracaceae bacterium]|nr:hypothetical protein [Bacteriovoracaceae bacterium]
MKSKAIKKLSFVLYEDKFPPRYYSISKSFLRFLLFGLPTFTLICLVLVAAGGIYFKQIQRLAERKEPAIIKKLKSEKDDLLLTQAEIQNERDLLQKKLSEGVQSESGLSSLALFKQSPGRKDLSSSPEMQLEEIEVISQPDLINISFKIVNMTKNDSRLTGYLFVIMQIQDNLQVWPAGAFDNEAMQISFANGEFFATSRFRPVRADFRKVPGSTALFKVVILGRTGDLIFKQLISKPI